MGVIAAGTTPGALFAVYFRRIRSLGGAGSQPYREPETTHPDLPPPHSAATLKRLLRGSYITIAFFSGVRDSEVKHPAPGRLSDLPARRTRQGPRRVRDRHPSGSFRPHISRTSAAGARNAGDVAGHATITPVTDLGHSQDQVASGVCPCRAAHRRLMRSFFQFPGGGHATPQAAS